MTKTMKKAKASASPLANIAAENIDRAISEIEGTIAALGNVTSHRSGTASAMLNRAARLIQEARTLTIETFENDF